MPGMELSCQPQQLRVACGWQLGLHGYLPRGLWGISVLLCGFEQLGSYGVCVCVGCVYGDGVCICVWCGSVYGIHCVGCVCVCAHTCVWYVCGVYVVWESEGGVFVYVCVGVCVCVGVWFVCVLCVCVCEQDLM